MTSDPARWFMILVLLAFVVGMALWARGPEHHHGQYIGAMSVRATVSVGLEA